MTSTKALRQMATEKTAKELVDYAIQKIGICAACNEEVECRADEDCDHCCLVGEIYQALTEAERRGFERGLEEAIKKAKTISDDVAEKMFACGPKLDRASFHDGAKMVGVAITLFMEKIAFAENVEKK